MQTSKSRPRSLELPQKQSSLQIARRIKTGGTESDPKTKTVPKTQISKVVADRSSPRIPLNEIQKKRTGKIPELESQISQLQEELKKANAEVNRAEVLKREAEEEAEETKQQLMEINASEDSRIEELRKLSQERDKTWQSELEAMQRQHGMDSAALSSAINEVQKLKSKLFESESELEQSKFEVRSLEKLVRQLEEERRNSRDSSSSSMEVEKLKSAVEVAETRSIQREAELAEELKRAKDEIEGLRKQLMDKKKEDEFTGDLKRLELVLMEKEMELQSLRSEMEKKMETVNIEAMEAELRRVKIQCEQWRKAAETAASILKNEEERTYSIENGNMLKKIGVLLKKNQK